MYPDSRAPLDLLSLEAGPSWRGLRRLTAWGPAVCLKNLFQLLGIRQLKKVGLVALGCAAQGPNLTGLSLLFQTTFRSQGTAVNKRDNLPPSSGTC